MTKKCHGWLLLVALSATQFSACSDESKHEAQRPAPKPAENVFGLIGVQNSMYQTDCLPEPGKSGLFYREAVWFREHDFDKVWTEFEGPGCMDANKLVTYSYKLGEVEKRLSPELPGWQSFRYSYLSVSVTPEHTKILEAFNQWAVYQHSAWILHEPVEVTGKAYAERYAPVPSRGDLRVSTVKVEPDSISVARHSDQGFPLADNPAIYRRVVP